MKQLLPLSLFALTCTLAQPVLAQAVERARPAGWERLVPGGRFMDRFEVSRPIGELTSDCWGGDNVKPRDVRNGMESAEYSYWGGNITPIGGKYHLFVARWRECEPKGHMHWHFSEIAHCVSDRCDGDFKVVSVVGPGHNPELFRCKDGSWALYCIDARGKAHVYRAADVDGEWRYGRLALDSKGKKLIEGESNFSFTRRPDGSVLAVCRGGAIWLSEDGIRPFVMMTEQRAYPDVEGRFEDPVLWRDEVQYHMIVNDWLGRVAWYLTSPDGFAWTTQPGEAYRPGIAKIAGGGSNDWFKYERMRVLQDEFGRVVQANFAVIDCVKREDRGGDIHSSKNITIPVNPGRRVRSFRKTKTAWEMRIAKEAGFDPRTDVDVGSVILGPQSFVAFGQGVRPVGSAEADGDLVLRFPLVELDSAVVKAMGRERNGRLFFATCRTDGSRLEGACR
ncbi:MAG: glycoside hydrolase family protein [Kiritimatiellia bacterium]